MSRLDDDERIESSACVTLGMAWQVRWAFVLKFCHLIVALEEFFVFLHKGCF